MKKKNKTKKPPSEVHTFRCTLQEHEELRSLAAKCGLSLSRYLVETSLKHHPRQRLTADEVEALNSLATARVDLIKISNVLAGKSDEEKAHYFNSRKFMSWWVDSVAELIQHWYSIEENIASNVTTKTKEVS
jgi:hypothetical protein